jgi:hypothetical protein
LIDHRSSAETPHLLLGAALEYCAAGGAKVATVMGHAGADTLNVRDILVTEPHRVWFASRALLRGPLLRSCGQRRACERDTEKRKGRDWSHISMRREFPLWSSVGASCPSITVNSTGVTIAAGSQIAAAPSNAIDWAVEAEQTLARENEPGSDRRAVLTGNLIRLASR